MAEKEGSRTVESGSKAGKPDEMDAQVSASTLAQALSGAHFPKRKDDLKEYAKRRTLDAELNGAKEVLSALDRLPDREYRNIADVQRSVGQAV